MMNWTNNQVTYIRTTLHTYIPTRQRNLSNTEIIIRFSRSRQNYRSMLTFPINTKQCRHTQSNVDTHKTMSTPTKLDLNMHEHNTPGPLAKGIPLLAGYMNILSRARNGIYLNIRIIICDTSLRYFWKQYKEIVNCKRNRRVTCGSHLSVSTLTRSLKGWIVFYTNNRDSVVYNHRDTK